MATKTPEQYAATKGTRCPCCNSEELSGSSIDVVEGEAFQEMSCVNCEAMWKDVYRLVGYDELEEGTGDDSEEA